MSGFQQTSESMPKKQEKKCIWGHRTSIGTSLGYDTDVGTISQGIYSNYDWYIKGSNGNKRRHSNISREREREKLRKNQKKILEITNTVTDWRMCWIDSTVAQT